MKNFFSHDPKLLFYGFLIVFFASYGQTFFISLFNTDIREFYVLSDGEFGFVYAISTLFSSFILISFAKLIDHIDLRTYSLIVTIGLLLACFGMVMLLDHVLYLFLIIFMLRFFGQGAMTHAGETTMARYFGKNRGKALSVATLGGMSGVMFLPYITLNYFKNIEMSQLWLYASISIIFFIPFIFLALSDQQARHNKFDQELINDPLNLKLRTSLMFHQIYIFGQKGWSLEMLGNGYILFGFFSILGLLIGGPIIDKFNTKKTAITVLVPLLLSVIILLLFDNIFFLMAYMCLYGLNMGISAPFIGSLWAEIYGVKSLGTVKALLHAGSVFASAFGPLVFGYLIDWGFGITTIATISITLIVVSTLVPIYKKLP